MLDNRERHQSEGLDFYQGLHLEYNHVELHMASMLRERLSPFKAFSQQTFDPADPAYRKLIHNRIKDYIKETKSEKVVFSTEGLSYLRISAASGH